MRENAIRVAFGTQREFVLSQEDQTIETEKIGRVFYSTIYSYITRYLCGGQHCVFIQAEDSVGHYGLVGQETAAHHLQRETQSTKGYNHIVRMRAAGFPSSNNINL